jgi:hypothetical protein
MNIKRKFRVKRKRHGMTVMPFLLLRPTTDLKTIAGVA